MVRPIAVSAIVGALLLSGCGRAASTSPSPTPPALHAAASLKVTHFLPGPDLAAAHLSNIASLVTPLNVPATDQGRTITLVGAYADPARTVFFFHGAGHDQLEGIDASDAAGLINSGGSSGSVMPIGDFYYAMDEGPRPGPDGMAQLTVQVRRIHTWPYGADSRIISGTWVYSISVNVQPTAPLAAPSQFKLGGWKANIDVLEVTPSVVHLRAVISGASPTDLVGPAVGSPVSFEDSSGRAVDAVAASATITVPKQNLTPSNYRNSRINYEWLRPSAGGAFQLRFHGAGGSYTIPVSIGPLPQD